MTDAITEGAEFGPYRIGRLLGRGGMGAVYEAYDTGKDRTVALKVLPADLADDERFTRRFRREAHTVARLQEPHIIPIHDFGEIDGRLFIDMRLVQGKDLRTLVAAGALGSERALHIVGQVAEALDAAHAEGLIHRDVKPENVLVTEHDFAYLVDFGIAVNEMETRLTGAGGTIGSTAYMAPERFRDDPITPSADIYALTCVLYEAVTGHSPLARRSVSAQIAAHLYEQPRFDADVPESFRDVMRAGLAKDPTQRFASAGRMVRAARDALMHPHAGSVTALGASALPTQDASLPAPGSEPTVFTTPTGAAPAVPAAAAAAGPVTTSRPSRGSQTLRVVAAAAAAVALVAAGAFGFRALSDDDTRAAQTPAGQTAAQQGSTDEAPETSASESETSTAMSSTSSSSSASPTDGNSLAQIEPTDDADAQNILGKVRAADRKTSPLNGRWVAQVASQYAGVTDEAVQPGPMTRSDILRHHREWRTDPRLGGAKVILVKENDFGKIERGKPEIWITLVMIDKPAAQDGRDWCMSAFSMGESESREVCAVRQFVPAHG